MKSSNLTLELERVRREISQAVANGSMPLADAWAAALAHQVVNLSRKVDRLEREVSAQMKAL